MNLLLALATVQATGSVLAMTPELVGGYFISLSRKGLSMATLHRRRASIAEFARWGLRKRLWIDDPMADTQKIARPRSLPKPYTPEERARLWRSISRATRRCCAACSTGAARA